MGMNFEGFQDLMRRIARTWYERAKSEIIEMNMVNNYLKESAFVAKQTPENELAYEKLMDVRLKMVDLSYEIDRNHDAYMRFMGTTLNSLDLKTSLEDYKHEKSLGHQVQKFVPPIETTFNPLPASIESLFEKEVGKLVSNKLPGYQESELRYLTFLYTCPLSVLYGVEQAGLSSGPVEEAESLTIHLVGARLAEMRHLVGWEIIALRLPKLKSLHIVFIGDEVATGSFPPTFTYKSCEAQKERPDLEVRYTFQPPMLYQNYVKSPSFVQPDVVAALDCGFKFYPSWDASIPSLVPESGAPCVFTEFTLNDTKDNLAKVERLVKNLDVTMPCRRNPFCSRRPVRCSDKSGNYVKNSVIFSNDYICVVRRKNDQLN